MNIPLWLEGIITEPERPRPARKRKLFHPRVDDTFTHPFNTPTPYTPPLTAISSSDLRTGQKRSAGDRSDDEDDTCDGAANATPKAPTRPPAKRRSRSNSPTKSSWGNLTLFEKPVLLRKIDEGGSNLPDDIQLLYDRLGAAIDKEGIIPFEVRDQAIAVIGSRATRNARYREQATENAESLHASLQAIVHAAGEAAEDEYHETAWNHAVHTPILKLVYADTRSAKDFTMPPYLPSPSYQAWCSGSARLAYTMSASIFKDYTPMKRALPTPKLVMPFRSAPRMPASLASAPVDNADDIREARSVSGSGSLFSGNTQSVIELDGITYNRSDSKKVDYVLVMDAKDNAPFRKVFNFVWNECLERDVLPHINQSVYRPLQLSPIACSIETKPELNLINPLVQLGTWVAAWHKRMHLLRQHMFGIGDELPTQKNTDRGRLPTTLLIKVVNHEWRLYFACDRGSCIEACGPLSIGSTSNLMDAYVLLTALEEIKDWIETTFREGLETWFMCDTLE
ncbi:hypothetical protein F4803DRAFT_502130 [Xylaria telfairii]|nr:hypothetical protein F4803DRAFT_502130 [Xylaria telfairii]